MAVIDMEIRGMGRPILRARPSPAGVGSLPVAGIGRFLGPPLDARGWAPVSMTLRGSTTLLRASTPRGTLWTTAAASRVLPRPSPGKRCDAGNPWCARVSTWRVTGPSLFFKKMQIVRGCDLKRNVLVYMVYSDKLIEGSPKNSTSTVPVMPWGAADEIQKCADWVEK